MRRKSRLENIDPFGNETPAESGGLSFEDVDESLFGGKLAQVDSGRDVIKPIPIHDIYPDPSQPRRALPSAIQRYWSSADSMDVLLTQWYELVVQERGQEFDLGVYLRTDEDATRSDQYGPFETAFLQVVDLAASIRRDGLTNPVTLARTGRNFRLETGERRWLAYHMLYNYFDGSAGRPDERKIWAKIPARQVEVVDVWRQANENNARENLNAISKARQFAVLLMNLLGQENFQPFEATEHEKDYYAQVADAAQYRVPSGKNELILNAMGITSRAAISRYRSFLRLPHEVWQIGDDYSLPEETLYSLAQMDPQQAISEIQKIVAGRNNLSPQKAATIDTEYTPGTKRHFSQVARVIQKTGHDKPAANADALRYIQELRDWLDEQEQRIQSYEK